MVTVRSPGPDDAGLLQTFVSTCPPLEVHTAFTYWVLGRYSSPFCFLAESEGRPCGLLTAVATARPDSSLYVWQLGVSEQWRGKGVAGLLLDHLADAMRAADMQAFEVSISPANEPSRRTFESFAERVGGSWEQVGDLRVIDPVFGHDDSESIFRLTLPAPA